MVPRDAELAKKINQAIFPGLQGGPLMHIIAAKAVAFFEALQPEFKQYQQQVIDNARAMCKRFQELGYKITSNTTDTHLFLLDLTKKDLTGKEAEEALNSIGIIVNKNTVPGDKRSPFITSGLRIGSCAITTRGADCNAMVEIVNMIDRCLQNRQNPDEMNQLKNQVKQFCQQYPIYQTE